MDWADGSRTTLLGVPTKQEIVVAPRGATTSPADLDGDGEVGDSDLALLIGAWGPCAATCGADLDGDGRVDGADLGLLIAAWSMPPSD